MAHEKGFLVATRASPVLPPRKKAVICRKET
jgi:hypothetical protein